MSLQKPKSPAMVLYEFAVKKGYSPPTYALELSKVTKYGTEFHIKVIVADVSAIGVGRTKQMAKQQAASQALELLATQGLYDLISNPVQEFKPQTSTTLDSSTLKPDDFVDDLKNLCTGFKIPYPVYTAISDVDHPQCQEFTYQCKICSITSQATTSAKKQAKQLSAKNMIDKIKENFPELVERYASDPNSLTEKDYKAINKYIQVSTTFGDLPKNNKPVSIHDFCLTVKKKMCEKNLSFDDFKQQFELKNKEGIDYICHKLDVKYKIELFQKSPPIFCAQFAFDAPLTVMAVGNSEEDSKDNLIQEIYSTFEVYMSIPNN